MKLFIDTSNNTKTIIGFDKERWTFPAKKQKSQQLLSLINKALKKQKKNLEDISEIKVNLGPGSFTGLRVGISVANALSWALKIPINDKEVGELVEPRYKKEITY